ncbi:hypothetical protein EDD85DRAFT_580137 [Armillaria nabsnona]|nr:hypothetical protein EDD85DRAFT_580137 [Armillaria nabsnona]
MVHRRTSYPASIALVCLTACQTVIIFWENRTELLLLSLAESSLLIHLWYNCITVPQCLSRVPAEGLTSTCRIGSVVAQRLRPAYPCVLLLSSVYKSIMSFDLCKMPCNVARVLDEDDCPPNDGTEYCPGDFPSWFVDGFARVFRERAFGLMFMSNSTRAFFMLRMYPPTFEYAFLHWTLPPLIPSSAITISSCIW